MLRSEIETRVKALLENITGPISPNVAPTASLRGDLAFDSLDAIEFSIDLEAEFDIEISESETAAVTTIEGVVSLVAEKLEGR